MSTADHIAPQWLARFSPTLENNDAAGVAELFEPSGFWRDFVAFTWTLLTAAEELQGSDSLPGCTMWGVQPWWWTGMRPPAMPGGTATSLCIFTTRSGTTISPI